MITTLDRRTIYPGDGANADFAYNYKVHSDSHLKVFVDGVDSAISVYGRNADQESTPGGTLTMAVAPANLSTVVVLRVMPETQTTDYTAYGSFPSISHEARLDEIIMSVQEHSDELARALVAAIDDDGTFDFTFPAPVANSLMLVKPDGTGLEMKTLASLTLGKIGTFVNHASGYPVVGTSGFNVDGNLASATWESVGPTDSGADNIYSGLDDVPVAADWIEVNIHIDCSTTAGISGTYESLLIHAIANGGVEGVGQSLRIQHVGSYIDSNGNNRGQLIANGIKIPIDAAAIFKLRYYSTYTTDAIALFITGYGYNAS